MTLKRKKPCFTKLPLKSLKIRQDRENNIDTTDRVKSLMSLVKTGNLIPRKSISNTQAETLDAWGVWIKDIEEYSPAEWLKESKEI